MQKKKSGVKKCLEISAIKGGGEGVGTLMANAILNFHFDYVTPSLTHFGNYILFSISPYLLKVTRLWRSDKKVMILIIN